MSSATELRTRKEAAERLRVSERTVERLIKRKELRVVRIGRRVLITERELEAYIAAAFRAA